MGNPDEGSSGGNNDICMGLSTPTRKENKTRLLLWSLGSRNSFTGFGFGTPTCFHPA
jgi:hypothetical protein